MSVLNQSGEEQVECPLCMEPLEVDDLNFFPCTCGYQICRFCWHRIRTDENGLCPACRKAYSEDPADFIPLSQEEVAKLKAEKRQKDQQRKAKLSESRKHLATVRVVQRNLVFVVGLPMRLADPEVLKRHEYFGKFGKIHKVVINQSTSYAGSQGPSASAYVTYMKSDDALRAIQSVNNVTIDGRLIKSSLGTTKYCSHFMKNQPCPKPDCMYLHDFGDSEASFTKEEMHAGKHQEYEKKLHDSLLQRTSTTNNNNQINPATAQTTTTTTTITISPEPAKATVKSKETQPVSNGTNKENWPQLNTETKESVVVGTKKSDTKETKSKSSKIKPGKEKKEKKLSDPPQTCRITKEEREMVVNKLSPLTLDDDNSSFFSHNTFHKLTTPPEEVVDQSEESANHTTLSDSMPDINTSEDWAAVFGFKLESTMQEAPPAHFRSEASYELAKLPETILDVLAHGNSGFSEPPGYFKDAGLDQPMSKFFIDFHQKNGQVNGYGHPLNGFNSTATANVLLLQQKKVDEHIKQNSLLGHNNGHFMNGDQNGYGYHGPMYQGAPPMVNKPTRTQSEDELDFDPFQETQKAFAELMANEQLHHTRNSVRAGMPPNGAKPQLPPPPPGFVYPAAPPHMNSFGSKMLPFLNMNQQQQQISPNQNWPSYNSPVQPPQQIPPQHHKNLNGCNNDWKDFDSAIVSSSRHYPPFGSIRSPFTSLQQLGSTNTSQMTNGGPPPSLRAHEYTSAFSNFTQHLQQQQQQQHLFNGYSSHNIGSTSATTQQPNLNWYASEINTQISSPPGFRSTNQTSKQQEC